MSSGTIDAALTMRKAYKATLMQMLPIQGVLAKHVNADQAGELSVLLMMDALADAATDALQG